MKVGGGFGVFLLVILFGTSGAHAARLATVQEGGADVYEEADTTSKVVEKLPAKTDLAASNLPTAGFHKVRTPSGEIGWVQAASLILQPPPTDEELAAAGAPDPKDEAKRLEEEKLELRYADSPGYIRQRVRLRLLGDVDLYTASGIVSNFNGISQGYSYGGELALMLSSHVGLAVRAEYLFQSVGLTDSTTGKNFLVSLNSLPIMLGLDVIVIQGPRASVHIAAYGGLSPETEFTSTDKTDTPPPSNVADVVTSNFTALAKADLSWQFSKPISAFLEVGYRYLVTSPLTPPPNNGALILNSPFTLNLSGPVLGAGIGISF